MGLNLSFVFFKRHLVESFKSLIMRITLIALLMFVMLTSADFASRSRGIGVEFQPIRFPFAHSFELQMLRNRWQYSVGLDKYLYWGKRSMNGLHVGTCYLFWDRKSNYYVGMEYANWRWRELRSGEPSHFLNPENVRGGYTGVRERNHVLYVSVGANWRLSRNVYFHLGARLGSNLRVVHPNTDQRAMGEKTRLDILPWPGVVAGLKFMKREDASNARGRFDEFGITARTYSNTLRSVSADIGLRCNHVEVSAGPDFYGPEESNAVGLHIIGTYRFLDHRSRLRPLLAAQTFSWLEFYGSEKFPKAKRGIAATTGVEWRLFYTFYLDARAGASLIEARGLQPQGELGIKYFLPISG